MPRFKGYDSDDVEYGVDIEDKDHKADRRAERARREGKGFNDKAEDRVPQSNFKRDKRW